MKTTFFLCIIFISSCLFGQGDFGLTTVNIGKQIWTSENLNSQTFRNGDTISEVHNMEEWKEALEKQQPCWIYNFVQDSKGYLRLGKVYNWYAVNDQRGLAPNGWHIPTDQDWSILMEFMGDPNAYGTKSSWSGRSDAQKKLKSTFGWIFPYDYAGSGNGTNESGFNVIPSGSYLFDEGFGTGGSSTGFWSSTQKDSESIWIRVFSWDNLEEVRRVNGWIKNGYYVRCIKD
jgi:uncharacterized protein (TIGR02145 family)